MTTQNNTDAGKVFAGRMVEYGQADGRALRGYLSGEPAGSGKRPGIVMVHEWWGLNENIRGLADRYAAQGYTVLAVDLYRGQVTASVEEATRLYQFGMDNSAEGDQNMVAAVDYLRAHGATSVGSMGYCFGGHWSLRTGLAAGDKVNAVVIYYGAPITDRDMLSKMRAPVLGMYAGLDNSIPQDAVGSMQKTLAEYGIQMTTHINPGVNHAFCNSTGPYYNRDAAEDAFARTVAFYREHLN